MVKALIERSKRKFRNRDNTHRVWEIIALAYINSVLSEIT